jgi:23S rRNA pseudoU1915 N3-methylase RlmH
MAAPDQASAPAAAAGTAADAASIPNFSPAELKELIDRAKKAEALEERVAAYRDRHAKSMEPKVSALSDYYKGDKDMSPELLEKMTGMVQALASDEETSSIVAYFHQKAQATQELAAEAAKLREENARLTSTHAEAATMVRNSRPTMTQPPMTVAHAASSSSSTAAAATWNPILDRIAKLAEKRMYGDLGTAKESAPKRSAQGEAV